MNETEAAALRERESTYRKAWREAYLRAESYGHEVHRLRAAVKRKKRVAEIGFKWVREYREQRDALRAELDATRKAKAENDERFMTERDEARREVAELRALRDRLQERRRDADEFIADLKAERDAAYDRAAALVVKNPGYSRDRDSKGTGLDKPWKALPDRIRALKNGATERE